MYSVINPAGRTRAALQRPCKMRSFDGTLHVIFFGVKQIRKFVWYASSGSRNLLTSCLVFADYLMNSTLQDMSIASAEGRGYIVNESQFIERTPKANNKSHLSNFIYPSILWIFEYRKALFQSRLLRDT